MRLQQIKRYELLFRLRNFFRLLDNLEIAEILRDREILKELKRIDIEKILKEIIEESREGF